MNRSVNKLTVKLVRKGYSVMTGMHQMKDGTQVMAFYVKKSGMPPLVLPLDFIRASVEKLGVEETFKQCEEIFKPSASEDVMELGIRLRKSTSEPSAQKKESPFEGIEVYLAVDHKIVSLNKRSHKDIEDEVTEYLKEAGLCISGAWREAYKNTFKKSIIVPLDLFYPGPTIKIPGIETSDIYVATNSKLFNGATAILDKEKLSRIAEKEKCDAFVLFPANVHTMFMVALKPPFTIDMAAGYFKEANGAPTPEEELGDKPYVVRLKDGEMHVEIIE